MSQNKLSYLALGDSYTVGESVAPASSWPALLSRQLQEWGHEVELAKVVATTGWTTDELINAIEGDSLEKGDYQLVSLLIGVNNQYRGYPLTQYKNEFEELLKKAIGLAGGKAERVFVVSIPDYGVTPFAKEKGKDKELVSKELSVYNTIARDFALKYEVDFYDITPISLKAAVDPEQYLAEDQLHPSAQMYEEWVNYFSAGVYLQIK